MAKIFTKTCDYRSTYSIGGGPRAAYRLVFTYTCPNGSGVGAIDRSDPLEHVFDPYCIVEVLRKIFRDEV